jgi:hypothetical protein
LMPRLTRLKQRLFQSSCRSGQGAVLNTAAQLGKDYRQLQCGVSQK